MIRRPLRPHFSDSDERRLLDALKDARDHTIKCSSAEKYGSHRFELCDRVKDNIDALAEDLTGDRTYFHIKPHGR